MREVFESLEDKRFEPYVAHFLSDIVMVTLIGVLATADEWSRIAAFVAAEAEWLGTFLTLPKVNAAANTGRLEITHSETALHLHCRERPGICG
ncbi:MAG: transposase family protein [Treponema sp.]|nr:transposase family protein [Treponema sp.]